MKDVRRKLIKESEEAKEQKRRGKRNESKASDKTKK